MHAQTDDLLLTVRLEVPQAFSEIPLQKVHFPCSWTLEDGGEVSAGTLEGVPVPCEVLHGLPPAPQFEIHLNLPVRNNINGLFFTTL